MVSRFSAGLAGILLLLSWGGCGPAPTRGNDQVPPELTFEDLDFRVYRGSVATARGHAVNASFRRDTSDAAADRIDVVIPAAPGRPEARVSAAHGAGNLRERRFTAWGGVRATQADQVATTEEARYAAQDGLVRGDRPIEVTGGRFRVSGPGFTLDPADQVLRIEGGARALAGEGAR
jgi:LPS export ABC transporter protein LptC